MEVTVKRNCNHSNLDRGSRGGVRCESRVHFLALCSQIHPSNSRGPCAQPWVCTHAPARARTHTHFAGLCDRAAYLGMLGPAMAGRGLRESKIHVRRTWTCGQIGMPKSKSSHAPVPLHSLLAEFMQAWRTTTPYSQPGDWVFASLKCKGRQPRVANMLVEYHLRPAAVRAGVLLKDDKVRFGFHNLRHSLASFLVRTKTDPKTVQALLRHSDVKTTLQLYAHSISEDRMAAQGQVLEAILKSSSTAVN